VMESNNTSEVVTLRGELCAELCYRVLQGVAVCCSVLQCVAGALWNLRLEAIC